MKKYLLIAILAASSSALLYTSIATQLNPVTGQGKVTICHCPPGNTDDCISISVSPNAVSAHLAHGDVVGPCNVNADMGVYPGP